jgi:hypothetical protein
MKPQSPKNKRKDSKGIYHGYPYANKKEMRTLIARRARRLGVMDNKGYKVLGSYSVLDIW